jgi:hypothetical protein
MELRDEEDEEEPAAASVAKVRFVPSAPVNAGSSSSAPVLSARAKAEPDPDALEPETAKPGPSAEPEGTIPKAGSTSSAPIANTREKMGVDFVRVVPAEPAQTDAERGMSVYLNNISRKAGSPSSVSVANGSLNMDRDSASLMPAAIV